MGLDTRSRVEAKEGSMGRRKSGIRIVGDIRDIRDFGKSIFGSNSGAHGDPAYREVVSIYEGLYISSAFDKLTANLGKEAKAEIAGMIATDIYNWRNK